MLEQKNKIFGAFFDLLGTSIGISSPRSRELYLQRCWPVIRRILDSKRKVKVIDAGCGHAHESILFAALGADVVGIDLREDGFKVALKNVEKYQSAFGPLSLVLINRNLFAVLATMRADVIWSRQAISHVHPAERFIEVAGQCLENNGILVINDSNGINPVVMIEKFAEHWRDRRTLKWYVTDQYKDPVTKKSVPYAVERVMSPGRVKRMLLASGLRDVHVEMTGYLPGSVASIMPGLARNFELSFRKLPLISRIGSEYVAVGRKVKSDAQ